MKRLITKILVLSMAWLMPSFVSASETADTTASRRWDQRQAWRYSGWERMKPKNATWQFAGGMGMMSFGAGWEYGKRNQWNTDVLIGFLPKKYSDKLRFTFTLKQTYTPWSIRFCNALSYEPLETGIYINTINGEKFWRREPGKYPNRYYNFSSKMRFSVFLGQSFTYYTGNDKLKHLTFFYELNTNELYVLSKATNKTVKMKDILRISFGLRLQIFKRCGAN